METCTAETGLLRKKPCGQTATQKCLNCERPLCLSHSVAQTSAGKKTGKYLCKECHAAWKDIGDTQPVQPIAKPAAKPAAAPGAPAAPPAASAPKPAPLSAQPPAPAAPA